MGFVEISVIVVCSLIVVGVIVKAVIDKKNGKTSCGCDCSHCSGCSGCSCKSNKKREITDTK